MLRPRSANGRRQGAVSAISPSTLPVPYLIHAFITVSSRIYNVLVPRYKEFDVRLALAIKLAIDVFGRVIAFIR